MPEISKITLPSGTTYDLKDTVARQTAAGGIQLKGETSTALTDGATTNPITINDESYTAVNQDAVFYGNKEFVFDGTHWHEFGDMSGLGSLASKNSAEGSYTPAGSVSTPTFTGSSSTFTGTHKPTGSVSVSTKTTENKTTTVSAAGSGEATYTPAGSVSAPTISVASAGATDTVYSITDRGTLPSLSMTVTSGTETLVVAFDQGTLPEKGPAQTVKTGDASYSASQPTFTGTGARLVTGNIAVPATYDATFTGNDDSVSVSGTPNGSVSQPTFTGTAATITVS